MRREAGRQDAGLDEEMAGRGQPKRVSTYGKTTPHPVITCITLWAAIVVSAWAAEGHRGGDRVLGFVRFPKTATAKQPMGQPCDASDGPAYPDAGRDSAERGMGRMLTAA